MNGSIIRYILGQVMKLEAAFLLLPIVTALFYKEQEGFAYLTVAVFCLVLGVLMTVKKPKNNVFYIKEGCVTTALSWVFMSIFGCFPFMITGEIPSFIDALFETVSGFTTTGSSILTDIEAVSQASLMWRSFTHWIGGMGVLVFLLAVIPVSNASHMNIMRAESPGPLVGKLVPKIRHTARILYLIYIALTVLQVIFLLVGGMNLFDSLSLTFGTAGTGGFGFKNDSCAGFSPYVQWVITIFMVIFGVNFNAYYLLLFRQFKKFLSLEEVWAYFLIIAGAIGIVMMDVYSRFSNFWDALRHSAFQVTSIITTTGYSSTDFNMWSETSRAILVILMFVGACAGSTGGGIKVSRIIILFKTTIKEVCSYLHPKSVRKVKFEGKPLEKEMVHSVGVYFVTFSLFFVASVFILTFENKDLITCFTAVSATINNIGPGLNMVGPMGNFSHLTTVSKSVLIFDMLAGRLELYPILLLFYPTVWKEMFTKRRKKQN